MRSGISYLSPSPRYVVGIIGTVWNRVEMPVAHSMAQKTVKYQAIVLSCGGCVKARHGTSRDPDDPFATYRPSRSGVWQLQRATCRGTSLR